MRIYSLGTSTRSIEEFIRLLKENGVKNAIDIRRFPKSRLPHFCQEALRKALEESGLSYHYLGDLLGGFRKGGYEAYMESSEFKRGFEKLKKIAQKETSAFFCCERFPWRCHRRFITKKLKEEGFEVKDLY
jgi:uncharacterized protein (DUF488 family)